MQCQWSDKAINFRSDYKSKLLFEIIEQPHQFLALFVYLLIRDTASLNFVQSDSDLLAVAKVNDVSMELQHALE